MRKRLPGASPAVLLSASLVVACGPSHSSASSSQVGKATQAATPTRPVTPARTAADWNLDALTAYVPQQEVTGTIRSYGFALGGVLEKWQEGFRRRHPGVTFQNTLPTSDAAFPARVTRVTDLAPNGSEPTLTESLSFFETRGYHASEVVVASGSFDVASRSNGPVVFVHRDNPLAQLTMEQLDGIFGSERNGGMRGFEWTPSDARGPERNIRTWGQLGLEGEWADKPIQTYGHAPSGTTRFFQRHVLMNTEKWNPNYKGYVESGSKMISPEDKPEQRLGVWHMLTKELVNDRYGIAWTIMSQAAGIEGIKLVALASRGGGKAVMPSQRSFQDRSYPLVRSIYIYFDRAPGQALDPKLKEFLRFALSREGQQMVGNGDYLPLTARMVREQLARLD